MRISKHTYSFPAPTAALLFLAFGGLITFLLRYTGSYILEKDIYNLMWLDAWNISFLVTLFLFLRYPPAISRRGLMLAGMIACYGLVAYLLIFATAQFPSHAYWGDQKFRMAIIEKFLHTSPPSDYYYQDLPVFYPPVYYYFLSLIGRISGLEAYELLRISPHIISAVIPFLLFMLWRKVVGSVRGAFITLLVMLVDMVGPFSLAKVPHAFVANSLFVPWWLHYLEGVGKQRGGGLRNWVVGSLIGALLFSTYFYPYFIVALVIAFRTGEALWRRLRGKPVSENFPRAWAVLSGAALFSAIHWLPVLLSSAKYGPDRSRGEWYLTYTAGLNFPFLDFNWLGLFGAGALIFLLWRFRARANRALLLLLGATILFFFVASILGPLDKSLNITKIRDFMITLAGPALGLAFYSLYKSRPVGTRGRLPVIGLIMLFAFIGVRSTTDLFRESTTVEAKTSAVPDFGLPADFQETGKQKVLLTANEELFAFYPSYAFIAINEHYSHPASRFIQRFDFLSLLQRIKDPYLFNLVLRTNIFDSVSYLLPIKRGENFELRVSLSNYPNAHKPQVMTYPCSLIENTPYFRRINTPAYLFEVIPADNPQVTTARSFSSVRDSLDYCNDLALVAGRLREDRKQEFLAHAGVSPDVCKDLIVSPAGHWFNDQLVLIGCQLSRANDSLYVYSTFRVNRILDVPQRLFLHIYPDSASDSMLNYDYAPDLTTKDWQVGSIITLCRVVPDPKADFRLNLGFFTSKDGKFGKSFSTHVSR